MNIGADMFGYGQASPSKYGGERYLFLSSPIINPLNLNTSYESVFSGCRSFAVTDFTTVQMLGLVTAKNNMIVAMIQPRINFVSSSRTNFFGGVSMGNVSKINTGFSHILTPDIKVGGEMRYCTQQDKLSSSLSISENLSESVKLQGTLHVNNGGVMRGDLLKLKSSILQV